MAKTNQDPCEVLLRGVRLSYAHVYEPQEQENDDGTKRYTYSTVCIIPKDDEDQIVAIEDAIDAAKEAKWGDRKKWPKLKADRICLKDGDEEDKDEYRDSMIIRASSSESNPPQVIKNIRNDKGEWETSRPGGSRAVYSGCFANVLIRLWAQDNKYGKRVNASLEVVQFAKKGEAFGRGPVDANSRFGRDLEDADGDYGDDEDEKPSRSRRGRNRDDDDDEDERPSRGRNRSRSDRPVGREGEEDERPARRRSRDDDDDEPPARSRRSRDDDEPPSRSRRSRDDDEPPSRSRRSRDDEPPARSRRSRDDDNDDDDDGDDRRRKRL